MSKRVLLLYPVTNKHLGLWNDLTTDKRAILRSTENRFSGIVFYYIYKLIAKLHRRDFCFPFHHFLFKYYDIFKEVKHVDHLVLIDGALNVVDLSELERIKCINKQLKVSLYLINSIRAKSPILNQVRPRIDKFKWDNIFTFDKRDAEDFGYTYLGFNYYSNNTIDTNDSPQSDVYFVGGLKGGRQVLINETYNYLKDYGVICSFDIMLTRKYNQKSLAGANYYRGWLSYQTILSSVMNTNCIIEIVQEGQRGPTLRYYEAVCMNKKLLSNNPSIKDFPFYNPQWMKVFTRPTDIEIDWILKKETVNYGYNGEFSPTHFIDYLNVD